MAISNARPTSSPLRESAGEGASESGEQVPAWPGLSQDWPVGQDGSAQQASSTQFPDRQSAGVSQPAPFGAGVLVGVTVGVWVGVRGWRHRRGCRSVAVGVFGRRARRRRGLASPSASWSRLPSVCSRRGRAVGVAVGVTVRVFGRRVGWRRRRRRSRGVGRGRGGKAEAVAAARPTGARRCRRHWHNQQRRRHPHNCRLRRNTPRVSQSDRSGPTRRAARSAREGDAPAIIAVAAIGDGLAQASTAVCSPLPRRCGVERRHRHIARRQAAVRLQRAARSAREGDAAGSLAVGGSAPG